MDLSYLLLIIVTLALGLGTQAYIRSSYKRWDTVPISSGLTGAQAARRMLDSNGLGHIAVQAVPGELTDHFDPRTNVVSLSTAVFNSRSVSATAIACHECGHAAQHARGYVPAKLRGSLVPAVNFASNIWIVALLAGIFLQIIGLIWLAIFLYAAVILFQVITLPVELNASKRAIAYIEGGYLPATETAGAKTVLTAAALTYVAAALASLFQLVYLLGMTRD